MSDEEPSRRIAPIPDTLGKSILPTFHVGVSMPRAAVAISGATSTKPPTKTRG
jgi:hypothetical protein